MVTALIPVHGPSRGLGALLASLAKAAAGSTTRTLVVFDGEPEPRLRRLAEPYESIISQKPLGFSGAVNAGLNVVASESDVLILNSDIELPSHAFLRLERAARATPEVATVTPWTNNGTICSLPEPLVENDLPRGHTVDSLDEMVQAVSKRDYPEIPVGVGFCMYIRREALDAVGLFDEDTYGLGYGEEVDFCLRASRAGFRHVLDDSTFVYHEGRGSFGNQRSARVKRAERVIYRRYPEFKGALARFLREDPLRPHRQRVLDRLRPPLHRTQRSQRILHVVHGYPPDAVGGTENYASWLVDGLRARAVQAVYTRVDRANRETGETIEGLDGDVRLRKMVNHFDQRDPLRRNSLVCRSTATDVARFSSEFRPTSVHIHHLAGHTLQVGHQLARRFPTVVHVHDWWLACPRANLFDSENRLCSGPSNAKCRTCLPATRAEPTGLANRLLHGTRTVLARRLLRHAAAVVFGSETIRQWFEAHGYLDPQTSTHLIPYELPGALETSERDSTRGGGALRCGFVGALLPHKGAEVVVEAFAEIPEETATLDLFGNDRADPAYTERLRNRASSAVRIRGPFEQDRLDEVLGAVDLLLVPSIGLESFGLVIAEAAAHGVPSLVSDRGALPETASRFGGTVAPANDAQAWRTQILEVARNPPSAPPFTSDWERHVERVLQLHGSLGREVGTS